MWKQYVKEIIFTLSTSLPFSSNNFSLIVNLLICRKRQLCMKSLFIFSNFNSRPRRCRKKFIFSVFRQRIQKLFSSYKQKDDEELHFIFIVTAMYMLHVMLQECIIASMFSEQEDFFFSLQTMQTLKKMKECLKIVTLSTLTLPAEFCFRFLKWRNK